MTHKTLGILGASSSISGRFPRICIHRSDSSFVETGIRSLQYRSYGLGLFVGCSFVSFRSKDW